MLKKTITYKDFNDIERTEDFYFHLSEAEVTEMEMSVNGGLGQMLEKIAASNDAPTIIKTFKEFILKCYGEKSDDGRMFMKEDENGRPLANKFKQTEAYSKLYMELAFDAEAASKFVNGVMPSKINIPALAAK